jgi:3-oxoisoapionate decarboxylase
VTRGTWSEFGMRLGVGSYTYTWAIGVPGYAAPARPLTAEHLIARAAALGVRLVQICDNLPLDPHDLSAAETLAEQAARANVTLETGTRGIGVAHLRAQLGLARSLRAALLRVVIDTAEHHPDADEVMRLLGEVLPEFEQAGVTLAIENHDRFRVQELARIVTTLASPCLGVCLDTANSFGALEGPDVVVGALAPLTVSLHIKDFTLARLPHQMGFLIEGCPAGQGRLDLPWLLKALSEAGRAPDAVLELWTPPEAEVEQTIAKEARWAEESVAYLRTLLPE